MKRSAPRWFLSLVMISASTSFAASGLKEVKKIRLCGKSLSAEIARSDEERSRGLMNRRGIPNTKAMVFVFESERPLSFWMKNVPFDIDIGFFDAKGSYVSHTTMAGTTPMQLESTLPAYPSDAPAKYAVEVSAGFFGKIKNTKSCRLTPLL
ncbi:MAG TPA: DUF192 domain-containing protein [Bdellovibrionota bacterium]|jgi:uncharacterized membrane protein (UPF0127 family)|nr:DUF192 domain-containing protein [Bdellovibrionota bacterium]